MEKDNNPAALSYIFTPIPDSTQAAEISSDVINKIKLFLKEHR